MKGYIDEKGNDRTPCVTCKHRNKTTVQEPCYSCIDNIDLALHKPNHETEFAHYEFDCPTEKGEIDYQIQTAKTMIEKMVSCYDKIEKGGAEE